MEYNKSMNKAEKHFYLTATIIFTLAYAVLKLFTGGLATIIFGLGFIALGVIYYTYGNKFAHKANKEVVDYVLYWLISIFLVLFALFFIDGGDVSMDIWHAQIIRAIPYKASALISAVCGGVLLILLITAGIIAIVRKIKAKK